MSPDRSFLDFVLEQLSHLNEEVRPKAMFGGWGLYLGERFFAVIAYDRLYLKTNEATVAPFVARGMGPFMEEGEVILKNYYEVPIDVLENHLELGRWVTTAASLSTPKKPAPPRRAVAPVAATPGAKKPRAAAKAKPAAKAARPVSRRPR